MRGRIAIFPSFFKTVLVILIVMGALPAYAATAASSNDTGMPVAQLLNTDGTLNVNAGYSGRLDISGYNVNLDRARGPVFRPLTTLNAWSGLGGGLNDIVYAIAVKGTDIYVGGQFTDAGVTRTPTASPNGTAANGQPWAAASTTDRSTPWPSTGRTCTWAATSRTWVATPAPTTSPNGTGRHGPRWGMA